VEESSSKKQRQGRRLSFIAAIVLALPYVANAQSVPQRVLPPAEQRDRNRDDTDEQNRARERERALRRQQENTRDELKPAAPPVKAVKLESETPCVVIHQVGLKVITGDPSPASDWDWALKALDGPDHDDSPLRRCIGPAGIDVLTQRVQDALVTRGFTTTRVLLQQQALETSHALTLTVIPGRVRAIRFAEPVSPRGNAWNALPIKPGDVLNLRDMEQAIENFRRVPSAQAEIVVEPVQGIPGRSDLVIRYQQAQPFRTSLSLDDSGTKATGKYQGGLTLSYDNWWTLNDLFYVSLNKGLGGGDAGERGTRGYVVHYSVPFGYWLLGATVSKSNYHQLVPGPFEDNDYSGNSNSAEVKLSRIVYRNASGKTTVGLKAWKRASNNYINSTEVEPQRRVEGGWELGLGHKAFIADAILEGNLAYKRGTGAFGSLTAPEEQNGEGTSRFALVSMDASLTVPFKIAQQKLSYTASLRGQHHRTPLTSQDRFGIAGRYSIRGFDGESSLAGDSGWSLRNELNIPLGDSGQSFYIGLDHGRVSGPSTEFGVGKSLTGAVLGLRGALGKLQYDLFVGAPVKKPELFQTPRYTAGFSLNASF
jgi:hemolysin activation/secretion protein